MKFEIEFFFYVFDLVFDLWWGLLLSQAARLRTLARMYGLLAGMRIFLLFSPEPLPSLAIPEPANTILFFAAGLVIAAVYLFRFAWQKFKQ